MSNIYMYIGVFFFFSVLIYGITIILSYSKKKKLLLGDKKNFYTLVSQVSTIQSSKERIIDFDKLYHKILLALGYEGTFGEILKIYPNEIPDINLIWRLHKVRNVLVHDFSILQEHELLMISQEYENEIKKILKKL